MTKSDRQYGSGRQRSAPNICQYQAGERNDMQRGLQKMQPTASESQPATTCISAKGISDRKSFYSCHWAVFQSELWKGMKNSSTSALATNPVLHWLQDSHHNLQDTQDWYTCLPRWPVTAQYLIHNSSSAVSRQLQSYSSLCLCVDAFHSIHRVSLKVTRHIKQVEVMTCSEAYEKYNQWQHKNCSQSPFVDQCKGKNWEKSFYSWDEWWANWFKSQFDHFWRVIRQFIDLIRQLMTGIRLVLTGSGKQQQH